MRRLAVCAVMLAGVTYAAAEPVTPGKLHVVMNEDKEITAKPGDIVEIHIPNPALAKRVTELDVTATGGVKSAGAVDAERMEGGRSASGGSFIKIVASVGKGDRSGTVEYSYKDGAGKEHKHKVTVQIRN